MHNPGRTSPSPEGETAACWWGEVNIYRGTVARAGLEMEPGWSYAAVHHLPGSPCALRLLLQARAWAPLRSCLCSRAFCISEVLGCFTHFKFKGTSFEIHSLSFVPKFPHCALPLCEEVGDDRGDLPASPEQVPEPSQPEPCSSGSRAQPSTVQHVLHLRTLTSAWQC